MQGLYVHAFVVGSQTGPNLAYNKTTEQSTTYSESDVVFSASRAVNGDLTDFSHTLGIANQWWRVDLGRVYYVSVIKIYSINATCCGKYVRLVLHVFSQSQVY